MPPSRVALLLALTWAPTSCTPARNVQCLVDEDCDLATGAICAVAATGNRWCAYADPDCASGHRYSDYEIGDGLAGTCVPPAPGAPRVLSVTPPESATDVEVRPEVRVAFSEPMDPTSIDASTIRLARDGTPVTVAVSYEAATRTAVLRPPQPLERGVSYVASVLQAARDLDGNGLVEAATWTFTVGERQWDAPGRVDVAMVAPSLAMGPSGTAVAVWSPDGSEIWARIHDLTSGWGAPQRIASDGEHAAPRVAVATSGDGFAIWSRGAGLYASRRSAGSWSEPVRIDASESVVRVVDARVGVSDRGEAIVTWLEDRDGLRSLVANRFTIEAGWGAATRLESPGPGNYRELELSVNATGKAVAVWLEPERAAVWAIDLDLRAGWGLPHAFESSEGEPVTPGVLIDAGGEAICVWGTLSLESPRISQSRHTAGRGWSTPIDLAVAWSPSDMRIARASASASVVLWSQTIGSAQSIWASRVTLEAGWEAPQRISVDDTATGGFAIAADAHDRAVAIWGHSYPAAIWARRLHPDGRWGTPHVVHAVGVPASSVQIAADPDGNALALWDVVEASTYWPWFSTFR